VWLDVVDSVVPVLVAVTTATGAYMVAKLSSVQRQIRTNRGSQSIGDAIDTLQDSVARLAAHVDDVRDSVAAADSKIVRFENSLRYVENEVTVCHLRTMKSESTGATKVVQRQHSPFTD